MRLHPLMRPALLLTAGMLTGCRSMPEGMDEFWRHYDPVGHRRYHRDAYYPNERRTGLRLPRDD
jgi:hypothetical protein